MWGGKRPPALHSALTISELTKKCQKCSCEPNLIIPMNCKDIRLDLNKYGFKKNSEIKHCKSLLSQTSQKMFLFIFCIGCGWVKSLRTWQRLKRYGKILRLCGPNLKWKSQCEPSAQCSHEWQNITHAMQSVMEKKKKNNMAKFWRDLEKFLTVNLRLSVRFYSDRGCLLTCIHVLYLLLCMCGPADVHH